MNGENHIATITATTRNAYIMKRTGNAIESDRQPADNRPRHPESLPARDMQRRTHRRDREDKRTGSSEIFPPARASTAGEKLRRK